MLVRFFILCYCDDYTASFVDCIFFLYFAFCFHVITTIMQMSFVVYPQVSIRYGSAGPCVDGAGHDRTRGVKNSHYSECFANSFFDSDESY